MARVDDGKHEKRHEERQPQAQGNPAIAIDHTGRQVARHRTDSTLCANGAADAELALSAT